jgi:hypothetical protein
MAIERLLLKATEAMQDQTRKTWLSLRICVEDHKILSVQMVEDELSALTKKKRNP